MLYGGDETDTFAKPGAPVNIDTGYSYYLPPDHPDYQPFRGDFDVLLQFGYMKWYPENPFVDPQVRYRIKTNPEENGFGPLEFQFGTSGKARTNIWVSPFDRSLFYVRRFVGGGEGTLMWDVSEGQRHAPWPVVLSPAPEYHWTGYRNPLVTVQDKIRDFDLASPGLQFPLTPGNFYYYGIFEGLAGYTSFINSGGDINPEGAVTGLVIGYKLCGYGAPDNLGEDAYNLWGDFEERSLFTFNEPMHGMPQSTDELTTGPDGRKDGVIIILDSMVSINDEN
jgi:hypothetical protein